LKKPKCRRRVVSGRHRDGFWVEKPILILLKVDIYAAFSRWAKWKARSEKTAEEHFNCGSASLVFARPAINKDTVAQERVVHFLRLWRKASCASHFEPKTLVWVFLAP
jgi:hypothetical protein